MENEISILEENSIRSKIHVIRGQQVMLDFDLAQIYGYETKRFNEQVKNNIERFDEDFMFQLSETEIQELSRSKFSTLKSRRGSNIKYAPKAFTEQGIYMLMTVLKGDLAVAQSKMLIRTFKEIKHFVQNNSHIFVELDDIKKHLLESDLHQKETDIKIKELFSLMDKYNIKETQGIFFQGQIFDAYAKFESFLAAAKKEIILIDNYVDLSILQRLARKKKGVTVTIYTDPKTKLTSQDIQTFNAQYPTLTVSHTTKTHDRFLIIDNSTIYHIGASLKDLGKKCFGFSILDSSFIPMILGNL
ncbi:MAG: ORF6N domain-containing protein [Treponema sp.]|nr:ORF6N domain-containing protein [Treponema sp.]